MFQQPSMPWYPLRVLSAVILALASRAAVADELDHERARAALARGEILPITEILLAASAEVAGDVLEVELEREHGLWVYEVTIIDANGHRREILLDAADARVLEVELD
jgi:uncharacterized membrane protein YkoI